MGLVQGSFEWDGAARFGYHIHAVQENSPALQAGLEPYYDFIISIGNIELDGETALLKDLLKANMERVIKIEVYNSRTQRVREVEVTPNNRWGGDGLLGASVHYCRFERAIRHVWHVLEVECCSPAAAAGLVPYFDFIVGAEQILQESEDFFALIDANDGIPVKLQVYSALTDQCREVVVTPNAAWGGVGSLGCDIGYGYLHRIPVIVVQPAIQDKGVLQAMVTGSSEEMVHQPEVSLEADESSLSSSEEEFSQDEDLPDDFEIPDVLTPDLIDMLSTSDFGEISMFGNFGDNSDDEWTLDDSLLDLLPASPEMEAMEDDLDRQALVIDMIASAISESANEFMADEMAAESQSDPS